MAQMIICSNPPQGPGIRSHGLLFSSPSHSNSFAVCDSIRWCSVVLGQVRHYVLLYQAIGLYKDLGDCIYRLAFCVSNMYCTFLEKQPTACHEWGSRGSAESIALEF